MPRQRRKGNQRLQVMIDLDSEEDIRRLLKSVYKPATPSPEFKKRLLERLRREAEAGRHDRMIMPERIFSISSKNKGLSCLIGRRLKAKATEMVVTLKTRVFDYYEDYSSLVEVVQAIGISTSQIYRGRQGKRAINEKFIIGALKAFPGYRLNDFFYVVPDRGDDDCR